MTENPAVPTNDAASLMKEVTQRQTRVREFLQRGGFVDFNIVLAAYVIGAWAGGHDWTLGRVVERGVIGVAMIAVGLGVIRRRRNLGGRVDAPTWIVAIAVFTGSFALTIRYGSDSTLPMAVWGSGLLALAIAFRKASLLASGATLLIAGLGLGLHLPLIVWVPPLVIFNAVSIYLGRDQLLASFRRAS
jgi:hypothetical protein